MKVLQAAITCFFFSFAACKKEEPKPHVVELPAPEMQVNKVEIAAKAVDEHWANYDKLDDKQKSFATTNQTLQNTIDELTSIRSEHGEEHAKLLRKTRSFWRQKQAPLLWAEAYTKGEDNEVVVLAKTPARCDRNMKFLTEDNETFWSIVVKGYEAAECGKKKLDIKKLSKTCVLISSEQAKDKNLAFAFVWKTLDALFTAKKLNAKIKDDKEFSFKYLHLVETDGIVATTNEHQVVHVMESALKLRSEELKDGAYADFESCSVKK